MADSRAVKGEKAPLSPFLPLEDLGPAGRHGTWTLENTCVWPVLPEAKP